MTRSRTVRSALIVAVVALAAAGGLAVRRIAWPASSGQRAQALYRCPMHPTFTSDRPGTCPICNMSLVKVEEPAMDSKSVCYQHECPMVHDGKPCPMLVLATPGESVECPACGTHVADATGAPRKVLYWTDPMLPGYRSDQPGKSPMGMDLVPVFGESGADVLTHGALPSGYAPVLLTPTKQQLIGVKTAVATRRSLTKTIRTVGKVAYDPTLYQAEEEYLQALRALRQAQSSGVGADVAAQAERLVEASRTRLRLLGLSGELIEEMGSWAGPDRGLLLSDPGAHVWVYASIYEYELPFVRMGAHVTVESPSMPGRQWEGVIRAIDPVLDPMTRSARVRAQLTDPDGALRPEMYVNASLAVEMGEVLAVPEEAVFLTGTASIVFVDQGQGLFEPRDVTIGAKADGWYEIRSGVAEGERVVTSGNFLIDSESRLKGALQGMGGGHQHGQ